VVLPDVVRATVLERIRLLDRSQRSVVMCASVIGHRFEVKLLMAAVTCTQDQVRAALDRACALELVVPDGSGRQTYSFRHALTRDVIYAELITARTRPLHRRIARALERITASSDAPIDDLA
jgi:predicted ATPase